jgi:hypothetical protein
VDNDYDLDQVVEEPAEQVAEAPQGEATDPQLRKLKQENQSLRQRLRRTEIKATHGEKIAELIPDSMPLQEWPEYAEKLAALLPKDSGPAPTDSEPVDAPSEERQATEQKLAAVVAPQAAGTPTEILSGKEIGELMASDPAAGLRAAQAKYGNPS